MAVRYIAAAFTRFGISMIMDSWKREAVRRSFENHGSVFRGFEGSKTMEECGVEGHEPPSGALFRLPPTITIHIAASTKEPMVNSVAPATPAAVHGIHGLYSGIRAYGPPYFRGACLNT